MKFLKIIGSSVFQIVSFIFVLSFLLGVLNMHFSDKNNYCEMTYMYQYPQYVRISVSENSDFPQYGLYAYSEGRFTERARKMWFDGVPVLYLPGNSGSHMQARSLASVALRKALNSEREYHFDYFTISYNEELSGLYGGVLQSQTKFTAACISAILDLYKSNRYTKSVPTSVILIGHSMGGVIAKRLLAYPSTVNTTSIAITLAAPLEAPVINFDITMNDYYMLMRAEWDFYVNRNKETAPNKILLSFGNGPRDILMPSGLTFSSDSSISALTTAIPGVWVSPDHISIVWCKQLVLTINRYLFSVVDTTTNQISHNKQLLISEARQYFQANRSMTLDPEITRSNVTMIPNAFWYEDNRRIYQISRPEIDKTTYLMIRLVSFPQNRFVAIEGVNATDKDWLFGCNTKFIYQTHRYCKHATSLSELCRWTASADKSKRKLATVNLHRMKDEYPDWTHVIVKVAPTRKPIVLNVDINDLASRQITVNLPSFLSFGKSIIKQETEQDSLYYELILPGFYSIHQTYLLYVEPTASCKVASYHVSAEVHVPWANNNEYYHFYTHLKRSPMKLRLYKSNPNVTYGLASTEFVKVTLLLDPQCTFTISITTSWYNRIAQFVRNYTPVLIPYIAAILLLAARSNILHLKEHGSCISIHGSLMSEGVKPYYALVFARLGTMFLMSVPLLAFLLENSSWNNLELQYFTRSLLVVPGYMIALGAVNIVAAAVLAVMVFSSQLAHRLLFRIMWRGGTGLAEKVASGLQKVPMVVSAALVCAVPLSCGAASLVAGAAFYAFMLSKMYEEYLEDYVYKIMAKVAARLCRIFKSKKKRNVNETETSLVPKDSLDLKAIEPNANDNKINNEVAQIDKKDDKQKPNDVTQHEDKKQDNETNKEAGGQKCNIINKDSDVDDDLNNLNFHMMMFFMWMCVTLVNVPVLLTWARNFKYSMVLKPDTSYHTGFVMSACSACLWQMNGPRRNLRHYDAVAALLFTMAVAILILGPFSLTIVNYCVTCMFTIIIIQQLFDKRETSKVNDAEEVQQDETNDDREETTNETSENHKENVSSESNKTEAPSENNETQNSEAQTSGSNDDCECNENRIYSMLKRLTEKFKFETDAIS